MKQLNKKGFTLIELLAVIVILSIVLIITVPTVIGNLSSTRLSALQSSADIASKYYNEQLMMVTIGKNPKNFVIDASIDSSTNKLKAQPKRCISMEEANLLGLNSIDYSLNTNCTIESGKLASSCYNDINNYSTIEWYYNGDTTVKLVGKEGGKFSNDNGVLVATSNVYKSSFSDFETNSNTDVTINNTGESDIRNLKIYGNTIQSGSSSFDTPSTITSVGDYDSTTGKYKIPITVSGNLIYHNQLPRTSPVSVTYNEVTNSYKIKGTMTSSGDAYLLPMTKSIGELKAGESITLAIKKVNGTNTAKLRITVGLVDSAGTIDFQKFAQISSTDTENVMSYTVTKDVSIKYLRFYLYTGDYDIEVQTQILKGSYTTDTLPNYEPYQVPQTYNIYLEEPLRKIGNYSDYIDFENRTVVRNIKEVILDGTGTYSGADNSLANTYRVSKVFSDTNSYNPVISNKLTPITSGTSSNDTENIQFSYNNLYIRVLKSRLTTVNVEGVKDFLASNPVTLNYVTKTTYTLPEEENIELPQIKTLKGNTIISVDTTVKPSIKGSY